MIKHKYNEYRRATRAVRAGSVTIGADARVTVQSMTNTDSRDAAATVAQVKALALAGADIVRIAVPDQASAETVAAVKRECAGVPIVADIHFDYRLALAALSAGADKIRINPGNIGASYKVREVVNACAAAGAPIRIGVNGGSLDRALLRKYGGPTPEALAESALSQADMLEGFGFRDIVISVKSSDVRGMVRAVRLVSAACDCPIHIGVTEAGDETDGALKNAAGIGALLCDGIGDTIRVSLTADPVREVEAGRRILKLLGVDTRGGIRFVSCPTCGRTRIDLIGIAARVKRELEGIDTRGRDITVAVMGCAVNGPGEAREADIGIAGGDGKAVLIRRGEIVRPLREDEIIDDLVAEITALTESD
jgi:(E)-4-hydroxy-3-methylbut-2-enyl-diphosphate synthase